MKLRVPGNFTGVYGPINFVDGVSVSTVSPKQANFFRASIGGVEIMQDDGVTVDEALNSLSELYPYDYYVEHDIPVPSPYLTRWDGSYPVKEEAPVMVIAPLPPQEQSPAVDPNKYSRAELEAIVDKKGIKGLREVAPEGVTGRSVNELMEAILNAGTSKV